MENKKPITLYKNKCNYIVGSNETLDSIAKEIGLKDAQQLRRYHNTYCDFNEFITKPLKFNQSIILPSKHDLVRLNEETRLFREEKEKVQNSIPLTSLGKIPFDLSNTRVLYQVEMSHQYPNAANSYFEQYKIMLESRKEGINRFYARMNFGDFQTTKKRKSVLKDYYYNLVEYLNPFEIQVEVKEMKIDILNLSELQNKLLAFGEKESSIKNGFHKTIAAINKDPHLINRFFKRHIGNYLLFLAHNRLSFRTRLTQEATISFPESIFYDAPKPENLEAQLAEKLNSKKETRIQYQNANLQIYYKLNSKTGLPHEINLVKTKNSKTTNVLIKKSFFLK